METSYSFVFDGDSLQEYIQYGDFAQAMNHIVNGGKTIIKGRYGFHYLDDKGNVVYKGGYDDNEPSLCLSITKEDILSKDWILF